MDLDPKAGTSAASSSRSLAGGTEKPRSFSASAFYTPLPLPKVLGVFRTVAVNLESVSGEIPGVSNAGWSPRICVSNQVQGDADFAGLNIKL